MKSFLICLLILLSSVSFARYQKPEEASHRFTNLKQYFKVSKDGSYKGVEEREIEILNEAGRKDYGVIKLYYTPNTGSVQVQEAYCITDGTKQLVSKEMIEDKAVASNAAGFDNSNQIIINFPDVKVGSKIYLKYAFEKKIPSLKNFFSTTEFFGWRENIEKQNMFIESELDLKYFLHDPDKYIELEQKKENSKNFLNITLMKPLYLNPVEEKDPYIPRTAAPYIEISSEAKWSYEMLEPLILQNEEVLKQELPEKLTKIATEAKKIEGFQDQVNFLIKEIQDHVRYFGDWRTIKGALVPRDLASIVKTGFGDCKDYSALLTVLLRQLGYDAHIAWVYRSYPFIAYPIHLPSLNNYNHAITYMEKEGKQYWFDATNNMVFTQEPLSDISNRDAVILAKNENIFKFIPSNDYKKNLVKVQVEFDKITSAEVTAKAQIDLKGTPASEWSGSELKLSKEAIQNELLSWITSTVQNVTESKFEDFDLKSRITTDYAFKFNFKEKNKFFKSNYGPSFLLWENAAVKMIGDELEKRSTDLFLKSPKTYIYQFKFNKMKTKNLKFLECQIKSDWLNFSRKVSSTKTGIEAIDTIEVKKAYIQHNEFSSKEVQSLKKQIQDCALNRLITLN